MQAPPTWALYTLTHIVPTALAVLFLYMLRSKRVHYETMRRCMIAAYILYLTLFTLFVAAMAFSGRGFCCDVSISFVKGLWDTSMIEDTARFLYNFIWDSGPTRAWPEGHSGIFRSCCVLVGYVTFTIMFITITSYHGWVMLLTMLTYSIVLVAAFHLPFAASFFILWIFCLYYQSQALRRKYWDSYNITPPELGSYFGDHFY